MIRWDFFFLLPCFTLLATDFAVTYEFSGGRLGDNLLSYLHAKWFSFQRNIPLIYRPFLYSSELVLDDVETAYGIPGQKSLARHFTLRGPFHAIRLLAVYACPYFPEDKWELEQSKSWFYFEVDWKDPAFRKIARQMIAPKHPLPLITPPSDTINIAIHVRQGGGYDHSLIHLQIPLKLPPLSFYIEGLLKIMNLFPNRPLYCYLFTDAVNPSELAQEMKRFLPPLTAIAFDYRRAENHHSKNVLEDFFSLFNFDILIRPQSNFSLVVSLLNDYAIVYSPKNFKIENNIVTITETDFIIDPQQLSRLQ